MREVPSIPWWPLFGAVALIHVVLLSVGAGPWDSVTKCLAAPLLVGWLWSIGAPRILMLAMIFCLGGDFFLEFDKDPFFLAGMASFALAHVCFIAWFVSRGALPLLRQQPALIGVLVAAAVAIVATVWTDIGDVVIQAALPFYALLLGGTAATALVVDKLAGAGAVLFLVSDAIIALTAFGTVKATTVTDVAIMVLYLSAIALLAVGASRLDPKVAASQ
ncbi:MAG: lysoplasmalogenase family protein [Aeromicrobium sp.]|uniref:lysoplasmalogenase family protein n=1 Tax=Aeromicrobium sp. TaxID=1871063 RepID=UPI0039E3293E